MDLGEVVVSKYKKKNESFSHSRLTDKDIYRQILQFYFAGYPPKYIAAKLDLKPQTLNRNLKKIRTNLVRQKRLQAYLIDEALKVQFHQIDLCLWFFQNMTYFHANNEIGGIRHCFTKCPVALRPKAFIEKYVDVTYIPDTFPFPISPESRLNEDFDGLFDQINLKASCKACPLGKERTYLPSVFRERTEIYIDLMYYLEHNRVSSDEGFYFHISMAAYISAVRRIAASRLGKARDKGLKDSVGDIMVARKQMRMVNRIYSFMAMPVSELDELLQGFRHSRPTRGFPPG